MVAIPAFLLASRALSALGPRTDRFNDAAAKIRIPFPTIPTPTHAATSPPGSTVVTQAKEFSSVLGPVVDQNFPDPAIIHVGGISYAFATNNRGVGGTMIHVQMASSRDNKTWTVLAGHDALPSVAPWETGGHVWAPDVVQVEDGSFVLYYADSLVATPKHHCVGVATSRSVLGPYIPSAEPFACPNPLTIGGAIDPDGFQDPVDGRRYVTYKVDGNSIGHGGICENSIAPILPTPIMLQEVEQDGVTLIGAAVEILDRDKLDGPLIEAPAMHRTAQGIYFLFFSSNCFTGPLYDTSYATATDIRGPYTKSRRPLFITGDGPDLVGPGGMDIIKDGTMIVFHGRIDVDSPSRGRRDPVPGLPIQRGMYTATANFNGTSVNLA